VYSPEAISAQQEFLLALNSYTASGGAQGAVSSGTASLLEQSSEKLVRWGITETQIAELQQSRKVKELVTIYSPITGTVLKKSVDPQHYAAAGEDIYDVADLSTVWVYASVYEYELKGLKGGQVVEATSEAFPGEVFRGKITFVSPTIEPSSRTVSVRAEFSNPNEKLKPEMFVNAAIKIDLPMSIAVPVTAVLSTGQRQVVWVKKTDGVFEPRLVTLGERAGNYYQILSGIDEGETVVTSGGYLIDSESQLQTAVTGGHEQH
jgi:Cu(I)/Ag(I) efflux system membrane fusion protein